MTAKEYVRKYYPNSRLEPDGMNNYEIWSGSSALSFFDDMIIGEGATKEKAWEDAKQWIEKLPEDQKPKLTHKTSL